MPYHVTIAPAADKAIARLRKSVRSRVADRFEALVSDPRPAGAIKLAGQEAYRIRVGDYRIIYAVHDDRLIVLVIDIGHRGDVYRRM